jgi:hypothetical protein
MSSEFRVWDLHSHTNRLGRDAKLGTRNSEPET